MNKHLVLKQSVIAVAMTLGASQVAMAQAAATVAATPTVYVTGSNLKRSDREGTSPVAVITARDIKESGAASVSELLKEIPSMGTDNNLDVNDGGFSRGVATASLRGLSSTSTLILLNGRRMTPSAYADPNTGNSTLYDLNSIPLSAIERVEILKDGASAVYGSDAIGGVINFITKSNFEGAEVSARMSGNDDGEFARKGVNMTFGKGDIDVQGWNFMVTADLSERDRTARLDMKDISSDTYRVLQNRFATPYFSTVTKSAQFFRETSVGSKVFTANRTNMATNLIFPANCPTSQQLTGSSAMGFTAASVYFGRTFCNYEGLDTLEAQGAGKDASILSVGKLKLGKTMVASAELAYTKSERDYTAAPITIGTTPVTNFTSGAVGTPFHAILEIGHPDNPFPNARSSVNYRFENVAGGTNVINESLRATVALKGTTMNWDWETGLLYNESTKEDTYFGRLYLPTLRKLNTGTSLAALAADPTIARNVTNTGKAAITQLDARASTQFGNLAGGKIGVAVGGEIRKETIKLDPDSDLAAGLIYGLANSIIDGERDVKSAFAEVSAPFLKNFEMNFAGRFDKYEGLKTSFVPKVGAKWTITNGLVGRFSYGEGFRAPALVQVTPGGSQFFMTGIWDPKRCNTDLKTFKPNADASDCSKSAAGTGGANPDLMPETSKSLSLGLIFSPNSSFDVLVDYFRIRKEKEVALGSASEALKNEDKNPGNVVRDTNPVNFVRDAAGNPIPGTGPLLMIKRPWINQGATEVSGIDLELRHRKNLGQWGSLSSKLSTTYMRDYRLAELPGNSEFNVTGARAGIWDWQLNSGIDNPKWKTSIATSWNYGVHRVNASVNYVGKISLLRYRDAETVYPESFCYYGAPDTRFPDRNTSMPTYADHAPECSVKSWTTVGLGYTYSGVKNLTVSMNIRNLLDTKAPFDPGYSGVTGIGYNTDLHNGYGRYFTVNASYRF